MSVNDKTRAKKRLIKGTAVYMIGNVTSKILQMCILPIVTASLTTSEYGYYDLIVTTISLVTPILTFQLIEGMFRFLFKADDNEKSEIISTVTTFLAFMFGLLGIAMLIVSKLVSTIHYPFLIYLNYVSAIIYNYSQKLARVQQKNKQFAFAGVINTSVMLAVQAITLLVFHMTIDGMLIANFVSYCVASLYLLLNLQLRKYIKIFHFNRNRYKELLKYSAPLIPNSIGWWLVASSDKYVITYFIDTAANGIYSIASKFSQILTFVTSVFQLAWQESAIIESDSEVRDKFYTETFNTYMKLLLSGYFCALPLIKLLLPILIDSTYMSGYLYIPILLAGAVFSSFSSFYGSAYLVFKRTNGAFVTTMIAAGVNVLVGAGLINEIGLFAPALGTCVAFGTQWLIRAHQLKDCFHVKIDVKALILLLFIASIMTVLYYIDNNVLQLLCLTFSLLFTMYYNRTTLKNIIIKRRMK